MEAVIIERNHILGLVSTVEQNNMYDTKKKMKFIHCTIENKNLKWNWKPELTRSSAQSEAKEKLKNSCFSKNWINKRKKKTNQNPVRKRESVPHIHFQFFSFLEEISFLFRMSKQPRKLSLSLWGWGSSGFERAFWLVVYLFSSLVSISPQSTQVGPGWRKSRIASDTVLKTWPR